MKKSKYKRYPREYTVVGVTSPFRSYFRPNLKNILKKTFTDIIIVVKNNQFYHFQQAGERDIIAASFIKEVKKGKINLNQEYKNFAAQVNKYENFIKMPGEKYTKNTIIKFYQYYENLMPMAYVGAYCPNVINILPINKRERFKKWAYKVRTKAEGIYKYGETEFVPRYLKWLRKRYLPKYKVDQLMMLTCYEVEDYLYKNKKLPSPKDLSKRKKILFIRQFGDDQISLSVGIKAEKEIKKRKLFADEKIDFSKIKKVKGKVAFEGKVKGRVHIISNRQEMKGFKEGDIIVSPMTEPYYLPVMKKAAGFVTDEGGMLCHAAIVARELEKPCLTSTEFATKVFKNGDKIELNADQGIVKKL